MSPSSANSTPRPELFTPPKGAFGWIAPCLLIQTEPHSQPLRHRLRRVEVARPDRAAEAVRAVVRARRSPPRRRIADDRAAPGRTAPRRPAGRRSRGRRRSSAERTGPRPARRRSARARGLPRRRPGARPCRTASGSGSGRARSPRRGRRRRGCRGHRRPAHRRPRRGCCSWTYSRFIAAQVWPLLMKAPQNSPSAIFSGSASAARCRHRCRRARGSAASASRRPSA